MPRLTANHVLAVVEALLNMPNGKNTHEEGCLLQLCTKFGVSTKEQNKRKKKPDLIMEVLRKQLTRYWDCDVNDRFDLLDPLTPRRDLGSVELEPPTQSRLRQPGTHTHTHTHTQTHTHTHT
jgi:hypothetical protein